MMRHPWLLIPLYCTLAGPVSAKTAKRLPFIEIDRYQSSPVLQPIGYYHGRLIKQSAARHRNENFDENSIPAGRSAAVAALSTAFAADPLFEGSSPETIQGAAERGAARRFIDRIE